MALETINIQSTLNAASLIVGSREDAVGNDVVLLSLTSTVGVNSARWVLVGRPEETTVGGASLPATLSSGLTASFTVADDNVTPAVNLDGTYVIHAILNEGSPAQRIVKIFIARETALTVPGISGSLSLRKLGGFESLEDTIAIPAILQGWATQMNRWLEFIRLNAVGGSSNTLAASYNVGSMAVHQTLDLRDAKGGGFIVDGADVGFTGTYALQIKSAAGGDNVNVRRDNGILEIDSGAVDLGDGVSIAVSAAGRARLKYNDTTKTAQLSIDTGAYLDLVTGVGTIGGSIADNQIAVGAATANDIEGSAGLTWNGTLLSTTGILRSGAGTAGAPSYSFTGDPDSGMYSFGVDIVAIAIDGSAVLKIIDQQIQSVPNGSVTVPAYSWGSEGGMGFYRVGAAELGVAVTGTKRARFNATGFGVTGIHGITGTSLTIYSSTFGSTPALGLTALGFSYDGPSTNAFSWTTSAGDATFQMVNAGSGKVVIQSGSGKDIAIRAQGSGDFIDFIQQSTVRVSVKNEGLILGNRPSLSGAGVNVLVMTDRTTAPTSNVSGRGFVYMEAGALKYRGDAGTVTPLAPA